jgi:hypothetical protein
MINKYKIELTVSSLIVLWSYPLLYLPQFAK